jgi:hypothetical protein
MWRLLFSSSHIAHFLFRIPVINQLLLGYPFLSTFPYEYLKGSFDLGRVFMFKWTVNFKFLPEEYFVSKPHAISLLLLTIAGNYQPLSLVESV